ncbi:LysR substrate-binding domain-containing protein [Pantoea sp. OXWO6B1]|uniref:LysR substrate-binding domain-containing protein n=1 Tax=Pantoea sp. OXWO6B1 TaxID=1835724 RepID=UPI0007C6561A|nr:LysR substrate-binding domain-containing protein [Pantoea sp. OXWO6B1]OAE08437.1 LysR family transcriptional regulator [Pantoea sp. OXWO6B1]
MKPSRLPPLGALRAFHSVASALSFKQAAITLNVSATAVSHQIRLIESTLECRVFERNAQGVKLTEAGKLLYAGTQSAFTALETSVSKIDRARRPPTLTITTTSNFLTNWLVPRLADFKAQFPHIDLHLHTSVEKVDLTQRTVDVAIRYREAPEDELHNTLLYKDRFVALASPLLALNAPGDLLGVTLFHVENRHVPTESPDWSHWKRRYGPSSLNISKGLYFSDETHALQAAVAGQGVVIASKLLAEDLIKRNMLVTLFGSCLPGANYYLVTMKDMADRPDVAALREWLVREMQVALTRSGQ